MAEATLIAHAGAVRMNRDELSRLPVPLATRTHKPIPHGEIVQAITESLGFRGLQIVREEFAAKPDGSRMFGVMEINHQFLGVRFALGIRNANDKSFRLALTAGYRVMVCDNLAFNGEFKPTLAKHSNSLNLIDTVTLGIDRIQRGFRPLEGTIREWQEASVSDLDAENVIYRAFVRGELKAPRKLLHDVHKAYFVTPEEAFRSRNYWSLSNAFTGVMKQLAPAQFYQATAHLGTFLNAQFAARSTPF